MGILRSVVLLLSVAACSVVCRPGSALAASAESRLGSADFVPTAECPVGWRGDRTGRFPAATPPAQWSRRVQGVASQIRYQAQKPSGQPGADSHPLEYFTLKEWLVAGPFPADDPARDIDKDFLGGETAIEPAKGDKAGPLAWQPLRAGMDTQSTHYHNEGTCGDLNVDFVYVFGNLPECGPIRTLPAQLDNKAAYAHTYIHSPSAASVMLRLSFAAAAIKVWLNGQPVAVKHGQPLSISLQPGWNRLLVKAACDKAAVPVGQNPWVSKWRFAAYLEPVAPVTYETRNIAWMTKLTGRSMSQPIIVGDRIFVGSGMTDLLCLDKRSGKILWLRSNTPYDALTSEQRAADPAIKEKIEPLAARLNALNDEAVKAINDAVSATGLASAQQAELDKLLKSRAEAERALHLAFRALDRKKYPPMYENEVSASNATPISDGQRIYWVCGGGMKGPGASLIACFSLDGQRIWSKHDPSLGSLEHGNHISPALIDGKLIYAANMTLLAFDAATGRELWRNSPNDWQNGGHGSNSPLVARIGDQNVVISMRYIHRASDGSAICPSGLDVWGVLTPIIEGDTLYNPFRWHGFTERLSFIAVRLPSSTAPGVKVQTAWELPGKEATMPARVEGPLFAVASPLFVDGVVYSVEMGGGLAAVDVNARKALYRQFLDGYTRCNRYLYGIAASPTLAGRDIYIVDNAGYTQVIEPGPQLKVRARNVIENIHVSGLGGNPCRQECFYTSPYFEGRSMYLRGEEYLYCITEP